MVVRQPFFNRDPAGRGAYSPIVPMFQGIPYGGIDRMAWFDIEEDFYNKTLPPDASQM